MRNTLVSYSGGGYDGCYWEWNFCFWDVAGIWRDLFSSGCNGADTEQKARDILNDNTTACYNLTQIEKFQEDNNAHDVLYIIRKLNDEYGYEIELTCSHCEIKFIPDEYSIAESDEVILCGTCDCNCRCGCCDDFVASIDVIYLNEDNDVNELYENDRISQVCPNCYDYHQGLETEQQAKDLFHQALLTGKPDLYDNEFLKENYWGG